VGQLGCLSDFAFGAKAAADGIEKANEQGLGRLNALLDEHRGWFFDRVGAMHGLWHVLTDYETDEAGEAALLAFSIGQGLSSRTLRLLLLAAAVLAPKSAGFAFQRYLGRALRRGRGAGPLYAQRYEELLPRPLAEVRAQLGIQPAHAAHPKGVFRGSRETGVMERVKLH
jgi:ubiquinone biosynthesis protein Coq4